MPHLLRVYRNRYDRMKYFGPLLAGCLLFLMLACGDKNTINQAKEEREPTNQTAEPPTTKLTGTCVDAAGKSYPTIKIGEQVWMAENLDYAPKECANGQELRFVNGMERGPGVKLYVDEPRYAYYENDPSPGWGGIYNHAAFMQCDLCPEGYRLPTKKDWEVLIEHLGGKLQAGKRLLPDGDSGFNARPAGRIDDYGSVLGNDFVFWWTTDFAPKKREIEAYSPEVRKNGEFKIRGQDARMGAYVRCVKKD